MALKSTKKLSLASSFCTLFIITAFIGLILGIVAGAKAIVVNNEEVRHRIHGLGVAMIVLSLLLPIVCFIIGFVLSVEQSTFNWKQCLLIYKIKN